MSEKEFNLLDEPWIRVRLPDCSVQEVSLCDALMNAQNYVDLAGETPPQDVAVLRLLLAVLHTVFSRVDETGAPAPICTTDRHSSAGMPYGAQGHCPKSRSMII